MTTLAQHLWLVKLLGYDYDIEYKQGRENVPAKALSRIPSNKVYALTTSIVSTNLMDEIRKLYERDRIIQDIIKSLQVSSSSHHNYTWVNDHLNMKGKVVVGRDLEMQNKLIYMFHSSTMEGHSSMTVTSKIIGGLFY